MSNVLPICRTTPIILPGHFLEIRSRLLNVFNQAATFGGALRDCKIGLRAYRDIDLRVGGYRKKIPVPLEKFHTGKDILVTDNVPLQLSQAVEDILGFKLVQIAKFSSRSRLVCEYTSSSGHQEELDISFDSASPYAASPNQFLMTSSNAFSSVAVDENDNFFAHQKFEHDTERLTFSPVNIKSPLQFARALKSFEKLKIKYPELQLQGPGAAFYYAVNNIRPGFIQDAATAYRFCRTTIQKITDIPEITKGICVPFDRHSL